MDPTLRELHQQTRSNVPILLTNLAAFAVLFGSLVSGWPSANPLYVAVVIVLLAYVQHCWTILFHEDAHYALYRARWHNVFNGTILGTLLLIPFTVYRQVHIRHHAKMNLPEDYELWPYADPRCSLAFRRAFAVAELLLGMWTAPLVYNRIFFVRDTPIREPKLRRRIRAEFALIVAFWSAVLGLVAWFGVWREFTVCYLVPAWLTGLIQTLRKFTEHLGLPAGDALGGARTVLPRGPVGKALAWASSNIEAHGLHHKYPQMPHLNLERAYVMMEESEAGPVFRSYWAAMRDMLPHLLRPGIGVNVQPVQERSAPVWRTAPFAADG